MTTRRPGGVIIVVVVMSRIRGRLRPRSEHGHNGPYLTKEVRQWTRRYCALSPPP
ncbi:hypothetical protein ACFTZB_41765 [Rhodococcus sp. NPDC057014]|uniref:hypothetical protein n=1 Tax=unclassified Rhodococcus (in: high G+C Gram-positive bacteria) TaxID=192944 RepID=UPI0036412B2B